jgi:hypothetical protein
MKLINKAAVIAEIENRMQELHPTNTHQMQVGEMNRDALMWLNALTWVKDFLNTIETKEVDLEKEIYDVEKRFGDIDEMGGYRILISDDEFRDILRHFFELGIKSKRE